MSSNNQPKSNSHSRILAFLSGLFDPLLFAVGILVTLQVAFFYSTSLAFGLALAAGIAKGCMRFYTTGLAENQPAKLFYTSGYAGGLIVVILFVFGSSQYLRSLETQVSLLQWMRGADDATPYWLSILPLFLFLFVRGLIERQWWRKTGPAIPEQKH